jgi:hypothetical protein
MIWRRENSWSYWGSNSDLSVIQPLASRYTDCATSKVLSRIFLQILTDLNKEGYETLRSESYEPITSI